MEKIKSIALWLVVGVIGVAGIYSVHVLILVANRLTTASTISQSAEQDIGATAVPNRLPHGYWDTGYGYYVNGTSVIDQNRQISASNATTTNFSTGLASVASLVVSQNITQLGSDFLGTFGGQNFSFGSSTNPGVTAYWSNGTGTTTQQLGDAQSSVAARQCMWNGTNFTIMKFSSGSTSTVGFTTSTSCQ